MTPPTRALMYGVARSIAPGDSELDDLTQEAMIRITEVAEERPDADHSYLFVCGKRRILELLSRDRRWTGHSGTRGRTVDPIRRNHAPISEDLDEDPRTHVYTITQDPAVEAAVRALPPDAREFVVRRFWRGDTRKEIAEDLGVSPGHLDAVWHKTAKPRLRAELAHLKEAA